MGNAPVKEVANSSTVEAPAAKPKCKACCACPETKKVRDQCDFLGRNTSLDTTIPLQNVNKMDASQIQKLPLNADDINPTESIHFIQQLQNVQLELPDVEHLIAHIKAIINKELRLGQGGEAAEDSCTNYNQIIVNVCFRHYYQFLQKYNLEDNYFHGYIAETANGNGKENFVILYYVLMTCQQNIDMEPETIKQRCLKAFAVAVDNNDSHLLDVLKCLNLIFKKWPDLEVEDADLSLEHIYFCLQSNQLGMRDEMLTFLQQVCLCRARALDYFIRIVNFWPWTYRNKLYMLSAILNKNSLQELMAKSGCNRGEFFKGLRSTLCYKNLLPASQHVIKALSGQRSNDLLIMCNDILQNGSLQEMRNLHLQWFSRLQQKEELFEMFWKDLAIKDVGDKDTKTYRHVLLCSMFAKEILQISPECFSKLSNEFLTNYSQYDLESQLLIYKFVVDNLNNLKIENCLEFVVSFSRAHMNVENSQFRNTILAKMSIIINHLAKLFSKNKGEQEDNFESVILNYFENLQKDVELGISEQLYQPKIYGLKLLEILIRSLYGETVTRNTKNCCLKHNQILAKFLKQKRIFQAEKISQHLFRFLHDPCGFDDALDLIVTLIGLIKSQNEELAQQAKERCSDCRNLNDVDEANLSFLYSKVVVQNSDNNSFLLDIFENTLEDIRIRLPSFREDPLCVCKTKGWHLFSSINVLNEFVHYKPNLFLEHFLDILNIIEQIELIILNMLNICNNIKGDTKEEELSAASFEDMDKSLEILVSRSQFSCDENDHEQIRKYLLMSFWLTLKSCCDLAASMAEFIVTTNNNSPIDSKLHFLERCINISVIVLTKCRHKGAIEAAGVTIGKITKSITSQLPPHTPEYQLFHTYLQQLYDCGGKREVSTTRRGAGFSIMFLHIVKNEDNRGRPILRKVIRNLLMATNKDNTSSLDSSFNCDRIESLHLHYLCVLVRDTELREAMSKYYNDIMMTAVSHIDNPEWTVRNAALQLLGALVPKIVGQRQATEFEEELLWEPSEVTFCEITRKFNLSYEYILNYCLAEKTATGSIILFLEFLHKVEYIHKQDTQAPKKVLEFREMMWSLLHHPCEKVRKLSAKCFVRSHEFSHELPNALSQIAEILYKVKNENFFEGLIQTLHQGVLKLQHDLKYVVNEETLTNVIQKINKTLEENYCLKNNYKYYSLCKLWDLIEHLNIGQDISNIIERGESECGDLIEAHKKCMREQGFNI
ncbi:uncharacterized protein LOC133332297 [Musca vetustissima]|uniref:uncharacterized protein LOC133332297 n=1 Tax=Musca vetustissima TaxID=27455 RepID=UPI002AB7E898|nr:uncharacterized protein LOC133332297 [Musca vetustissima]